MAVMQFREALNQAMCEEMDRNPDVFLIGEEVADLTACDFFKLISLTTID